MKEKSNLNKITAVVLVISMVLGSIASITTQAIAADTPSLDYIESIKENKANEGSAFNILEVTPDADRGQIGYIVDGYEPTSTVMTTAAGVTGRDSRQNYVRTVYNNLTNNGILGTGNTTPLESTGTYTEYYPWESVPSGASKLTLENEDTVLQVNGQFVADDNGDYSVTPTYDLPNLFDVEEWYKDYESHGKGTSSTNSTFDLGSDNQIVVVNPSDGSREDNYSNHSWGSGDSSYYHIACTPNTQYTITYTVDLEGTGGGQIFVFGYGQNFTEAVSGTSQWYTAWSDYPTVSGTYTATFTTGANVYNLGFRCGTAYVKPMKATFSDIRLVKTSNPYDGAQFVQDADTFVYGDAADGSNIFSMSDFTDNLYTYHGADVTAGMDYSYGVLTFDGYKTTANWTLQAATDNNYYVVDVEPNTKYTFTYTVEDSAKDGNTYSAQHVALVIGLGDDGSNEQLVNDYSNGGGTKTVEFTTGSNTTHVTFALGANNTNTVSKFSGVSLYKTDKEADTSGEYYYYKVNFTKITSGAALDEGTVVYEKVTAENKLDDDVIGTYKVVGTYYSDGSGVILDSESEYFTAAAEGGPSLVFDEDHPYRTVRDTTYHEAQSGETPYFVVHSDRGTYRGEGLGGYKLDTTKSGTVTIDTATVFYTGGYTSNDWFRYKVLDCPDSELGKQPKDWTYNFAISVETITPSQLADKLDSLSSYDLVVFSTGYNYVSNSYIGWTEDIPSSFLTAYGSSGSTPYIDQKIPTVYFKGIDGNSASPNMNTFIKYLKEASGKSSASTGWVTDYIYCFSADDVDSFNFSKFSTNVKTSLYNTSSAPYYEVASEIATENFLRTNKDVKLLPYEISVATSLRYIINFKGQRVIFNKDTINILDIEPYTSGKVYDATTKALKAISTTKDQEKVLSETEVLSWFPTSKVTDGKLTYSYIENGAVKYGDVKINIVTMASNELVADADDIVETYDIVYIGDSTYNMNTSDFNNSSYKTSENGSKNRAYGRGTQPNYNDSAMDGMYYSSTGDVNYTNARNLWAEGNLGGQIYDDYTYVRDVVKEIPLVGSAMASALGSTGYLAFLEGWNTFKERSSGNDLTAKKEQQLENFLNAGLPVIIADQLTSGFSADLTAQATGEMEFTYHRELSKTYLWGAIKIYKKVPRYHIKATGWIEGLPIDVDYATSVTYDWYLKKTDGTIVKLANTGTDADASNIKITTFSKSASDGNTILATQMDYTFDAEDMANYVGEIYAVAHIRNTDYPSLNSVDMKTNSLTSKIVVKTVYAKCERVQAAEIADGEYTDIVEVRPSGLTDTSQYKYYLDPSYGGTLNWYYVVRTYSDNSYNINKRTWIYCQSNEWHYRNAVGGGFLIDEPYRYADYLREGTGDGELDNRENVWYEYRVQGRGYNKYYYTNADGTFDADDDFVRVGTPHWNDSFSSTRKFNTRFLEITVNNTSGEKKTVYADANVSKIAVDNSSYMYEFLDYGFNGDTSTGATSRYRRNLFAERDFDSSEVGDDARQLVGNYLTVSTPKIVVNEATVTAYPEKISDKTISAEFTIQNASDVGAASARYKLLFYVDLNSDGKFKTDELTDFALDQKIDNGSWAQVDSDALCTTTKSITYTYKFSKTLSDYAGILLWKIEVIKLDSNGEYHTKNSSGTYSTSADDVDYSNLHDSYMNYAYFTKNQATQINAIQVLPSDWNMEYTKNSKATSDDGNLYYGSIFMSQAYQDLLGSNWAYYEPSTDGSTIETQKTVYMCFGPTDANGKMADYSGYREYYRANGTGDGYSGANPDFFVVINTVNVKDLNGYYGSSSTGTYQTVIKDADYLDSYNMLILGFADSWGKAGLINNSGSTATNTGLNLDAALAVQDFIESGKSVLFAHDTTTAYNNYVNNVILAAGFKAASAEAGATGDALEWLINLFGGDGSSNNIVVWLKNLALEDDERVRNGYWLNLMRDDLGLDRYGVTYKVKERTKTDYYACDVCDVEYTSAQEGQACSQVYDGEKCTGTVVNKGKILDKNLRYGYYDDYAFYSTGNSANGSASYKYDTSIKTMLANDYTIAYAPGTERDESKIEQQYVTGYTRYAITRYGEEDEDRLLPLTSMYQSNNSIYPTTRITQTNKGQITMYPYDINLYETDSSGNKIVDENGGYVIDKTATMEVSTTHEQVYCLNPNGDDITVWYCMSGENFGDIPNDCMNSYYIYSRNNVTYTGAGHTNTFTPMEAKLFANTLIAAYRPHGEAAAINFTKDQSSEENKVYTLTNYILLTSESETETDSNGNAVTTETVKTDKAYFKVENHNVANVNNKNNFVSLTFFYVDENGKEVTVDTGDVTLYKVNKNKTEKVSWTKVNESGIYYYEIPDAVVTQLEKNGITSVKMIVRATTHNDGEMFHSQASVEVRKLGLRDLS